MLSWATRLTFTTCAIVAAGCGWVAIMVWACYKDLTQDANNKDSDEVHTRRVIGHDDP